MSSASAIKNSWVRPTVAVIISFFTSSSWVAICLRNTAICSYASRSFCLSFKSYTLIAAVRSAGVFGGLTALPLFRLIGSPLSNRSGSAIRRSSAVCCGADFCLKAFWEYLIVLFKKADHGYKPVFFGMMDFNVVHCDVKNWFNVLWNICSPHETH